MFTAHTKRVEEELKVSSSCYGELSQLKEEVTVSNELVEHYKESLSKVQVTVARQFALFQAF